MTKRFRLVLALALGPISLAFFLPTGARAQMVPSIQGSEPPEASTAERQSVLQRARPDYDALGVRVGSFLVAPYATIQGEYNSNIFVTQNGAKSDYSASLLPGFTVNSDWDRNAIGLTASGEIRRYDQFVSENESNFNTVANGHLDIEQNVYMLGYLGYTLAHEDRTSPDTIANEKSPTQYQVGSAKLGYYHEGGRLGLRVEGAADTYGYNNNITSTGTVLPETPRDYTAYAVTPRVSYEYIPGYHAFIKAPLNIREYNAQRDPLGFKQDSHGYEVDAGTAVGLGQVVNGEVYVGYFKQDYDESRFTSPSGVSFGGNLLWNVTGITSIRASAGRSVQETTLSTSTTPVSSSVNTTIGASVEHELLTNVLLTGGVSYEIDDYQGSARTDDIVTETAGGRYLLNRIVSTGLTVTHGERTSSISGNGYDQVIVLANLRLQY